MPRKETDLIKGNSFLEVEQINKENLISNINQQVFSEMLW